MKKTAEMGDQSERNQERQEVSVNAFMLEKRSGLIKWIFCRRENADVPVIIKKRMNSLHIIYRSIYKYMFNYLGLMRIMLEVEENKNPTFYSFLPSVFCNGAIGPDLHSIRDLFCTIWRYLNSVTAATLGGIAALNSC